MAKANTNRAVLIGTGVTLIVLSVAILVMSAVESFGGLGKKFQVVNVPGFHELSLEEPGLYAGVYQHQGEGPLPVRELSQMNVRLLFKQTYEEIPVLMNTAGQTFNQLGVRGMPLFNFAIQEPGEYTMSAIGSDDQEAKRFPIMIFPQSAQNIKQTIIVGGLFFALFLGLGIFILVKVNKWAPIKGIPN